MELYVHPTSDGGWSRSRSFLTGLKGAAETATEALLLCRDPLQELDDLLSAIWLFRSVGGELPRLAVASPCPVASWIAPVRAAGVPRVFACPASDAGAPGFTLRQLVEVPRDVCPALEALGGAGRATSVCGARASRVVLSTHHFVSCCFAGWSACRHLGRAGARA